MQTKNKLDSWMIQPDFFSIVRACSDNRTKLVYYSTIFKAVPLKCLNKSLLMLLRLNVKFHPAHVYNKKKL